MQTSNLLRAAVVVMAVLWLAGMPVAQVVTSDRVPHDDPAQDKIEEMQRNHQKALNSDRHDEIKRDTEKLLQLSTELKAYVDKTNENVLSVDVIKKAEEIERLSKNIQKKMRQSY